MKYFNMSICVIALLCMMAGCGTNEEELFAQWEQENRQAWEQAAYDNGYDDGYSTCLDETREQELQQMEEDSEKQQQREAQEQEEAERISDICKKYQCEYWDGEGFPKLTIDIQENVCGKTFLLPVEYIWATDVFYNGDGEPVWKISSIYDLFYLNVSEEQIDYIRSNDDDLYIIAQIESFTPMDAYLYSDVREKDEDHVFTDIYAEVDMRMITGNCVAIEPME